MLSFLLHKHSRIAVVAHSCIVRDILHHGVTKESPGPLPGSRTWAVPSHLHSASLPRLVLLGSLEIHSSGIPHTARNIHATRPSRRRIASLTTAGLLRERWQRVRAAVRIMDDAQPSTSPDGSAQGIDRPARKKQKRNKPTLSCEECVERKTKVSACCENRGRSQRRDTE